MANFILIVDPDAGRRAAFCRAAAKRVAPLPGLVNDSCSSGDFHALWAAGPRAPIAFAMDDRGAAALWGDAMRADGARIDIHGLRAAWADPDARIPPFEGYHAAVAYRADGGLVLGADLIGMFPVYWWGNGTVLLAGSSPELFRLHPAFRSRLDLAGLAGMLLSMHSVGGRTLLQGVRRLAPGHLLCVRAGGQPVEREQYRLPISDRYYDLPFSMQVELLHEAMGDAVSRHAPAGEPCALSLSGGRDSRQLAGLLQKQGSTVTALTFGEKGDVELGCAKLVARATGFEHRTLPLAVDAHGEFGERHATWLHCSTGFGSLAHWGSAARMGELPPRLVTGYAMDPIVGGAHITWALDRASRSMSFDAFFARINAHGVEEQTLRALLGDQGSGLVDEARARIRAIYESYSDVGSQRAWCFDLHHRQRFHVANPAWFLSFGSWPAQPAVDSRVLAVAGGLPVGTLAERRAQDEILKRFLPALAELPLDRNSYNTEPLSPRFRYLVGQQIGTRLAPLTTRLRRRNDRTEHRFYYRVFDFNSQGWQAVRRLAEPQREKLRDIFDGDRLDQYLPPPGVELRVKNGIVDSSGRKMLVGLMLWSRDHDVSDYRV